MSQRSIKGNEKLARKIKSRRGELGLTIEEAASRAEVGTKTWCRYEAGESIRRDKCKGICKALNWHSFPEQDEEENDSRLSIQEYKNHAAWSSALEEEFGAEAAMSFAVGSDIVYDHIQEDLEELSSLPAGTHIGQLTISWLKDSLPKQFLMHYDYDFLYQMKCSLREMRRRAKNGLPMTAHSVMEEILLYLCNEEGGVLIELSGGICGTEEDEDCDLEEWVFDLLDDRDVLTFLYSNVYLDSDHPYHFCHWAEQQFYRNGC